MVCIVETEMWEDEHSPLLLLKGPSPHSLWRQVSVDPSRCWWDAAPAESHQVSGRITS
jgi:hypothetical protein